MARKLAIQIVNGFVIRQEPPLPYKELIDINNDDKMYFAKLYADRSGKICYIFDSGARTTQIKYYKDNERFQEVCDFDVVTYNDKPVGSFTGSFIDALIYIKNFDDKRFGRRS
ncbi:MAG: hypothetical protein LBU73_10010 [Helicobacteraceae bacterium]|jgi:hypothetical protein|nr:hypothetical protein [Helicobacteraceae bacterium]